MTLEELKQDPNINWVEDPVVGLAMLMGGNDGLMDSYADPIQPDKNYWVGKHVNGFLIIIPVVTVQQMAFNDILEATGRLN